MEQYATLRFMARPGQKFVLLTLLVVAPCGVGLILAGSNEAREPITLLDGRKPDDVRPEEPRGRLSRTIYYVNQPFDQVVAGAKRDLAHRDWTDYGVGVLGQQWFQERPGPLQSHGRQVEIRRNRCDPDSFSVLGKAADSKSWTTIVVVGGQRAYNPLQSIWRWITHAP